MTGFAQQRHNEVVESLGVLAQAAESAASLTLLRRVDETVDALTDRSNLFRSLAEGASLWTRRVNDLRIDKGGYIDAADKCIGMLERCVQILEDGLPKMLQKKSAIDRDHQLKADHCELLHGVYEDALQVTGVLVEALKDLRAAIIRHDLAAEPRDSEEYDCAGLIAALHDS